MVQNGKGATIN